MTDLRLAHSAPARPTVNADRRLANIRGLMLWRVADIVESSASDADKLRQIADLVANLGPQD